MKVFFTTCGALQPLRANTFSWTPS